MNLYASQSQDIRHTLELPMNIYSKQLIPLADDLYEPVVNTSDSVISLAALRDLPLVDQCRNIIKDGKSKPKRLKPLCCSRTGVTEA